MCHFPWSEKVAFVLTRVGQKASPRKQSVAWLCSQVLPSRGEWLVSCNAFLPPVPGGGNTLDRPVRRRGAAVYLRESKQRTVFTACFFQSCSLSLLRGCSSPPDDGARIVYVVCCGRAFSAQTGENLCVLVGWREKRGLLCHSASGIQLGRLWAELRFLPFSTW